MMLAEQSLDGEDSDAFVDMIVDKAVKCFSIRIELVLRPDSCSKTQARRRSLMTKQRGA